MSNFKQTIYLIWRLHDFSLLHTPYWQIWYIFKKLLKIFVMRTYYSIQYNENIRVGNSSHSDPWCTEESLSPCFQSKTCMFSDQNLKIFSPKPACFQTKTCMFSDQNLNVFSPKHACFQSKTWMFRTEKKVSSLKDSDRGPS